MNGATKEDLVLTEFMIHKVGGEKRYDWIQEEEFYKKKLLDTTEEDVLEEGAIEQHPDSEEYSVETASRGSL